MTFVRGPGILTWVKMQEAIQSLELLGIWLEFLDLRIFGSLDKAGMYWLIPTIAVLIYIAVKHKLYFGLYFNFSSIAN